MQEVAQASIGQDDMVMVGGARQHLYRFAPTARSSVHLGVHQPGTCREAIKQSTNQPINQPTNHSINPFNQPINQSIDRSIVFACNHF
jgi:hypothetical protein